MNEDVYFPLNMGIFHVHLSFRGCSCFFVEKSPTWDPEVASTDTSRISLKVFDMVCRTTDNGTSTKTAVFKGLKPSYRWSYDYNAEKNSNIPIGRPGVKKPNLSGSTHRVPIDSW